jgi:hypothetical protein
MNTYPNLGNELGSVLPGLRVNRVSPFPSSSLVEPKATPEANPYLSILRP